MNKLSTALMTAGIALIGVSAWMWYQSRIDAASLIELHWEVPPGAQVGRETSAPIRVVNLSDGEARVVGLNHC